MGDTKHVVMRLKDVHCINTEDITGADDFYVAGGGGTGPESGRRHTAVLTKPIKINDNDRKQFPDAESVIFEGDVKTSDFVEVALQFFDEDFNAEKDFDAKYQALTASLVAGIGTAVGAVATPAAGAVAAAILTATVPALAKVLDTIDKDDVLGTVEKRVAVKDLQTGRNGPWTWKLTNKNPVIHEGVPSSAQSNVPGFSDWEYAVRYEIDVT
ncbi:hypothetical protein [Streptomyces sp. NPDC045470]|uniref:hypothetical protein n=1 Tax=unclassified Streptomyces TaxID=2593676 RepID=UPI0033CC1E34